MDEATLTGMPPALLPWRAAGLGRIAFVHIPKTAGTSLAVALHKGWPRMRILAQWKELDALTDQELAGLDVVSGHFYANQIERPRYRGFYPITVLRDPFERLLSSYRFARESILERGVAGGPAMQLAAKVGFGEYVFSRIGFTDRHGQLCNLGHTIGIPIDVVSKAELLERAKIRLSRMMAGTAEELSTFLSFLFREAGKGAAPDPGRRNTTKPLSADEAGLTRVQREALEELLAPDRALHAFARDQLRRQMEAAGAA